MLLWNALTHKKEKFKPIKPGYVRFYTCGPTVYAPLQIGNLRTFIFEDILRRSLKFSGFKITQVMNITDIEDKIIKKAKSEKKNFKEITKTYTKIFFEDIKKVNIEKAEVYPKATSNIREMINLISKLLKKGIAYTGKDNSIYFDISKFKKYGALSGLAKRELKTGARIAADEYNKNEAQDFVLWKSKKEGEPFWRSPFGEGRPGWHIECSAMSMKYLGNHFDIHTGGVDNIFPHHENEIAQSEAATGKKFVNYWLEAEHLLVNGTKMAKSLGNYYTLRDIGKKGFGPLDFRYLILTAHYRSRLNFTWRALEASKKALNNLYKEIAEISNGNEKIADSKLYKDFENKFISAIDDDLNTPKALGVLWEVLKAKNLSRQSKRKLSKTLDKVLGLKIFEFKKESAIPSNILKLAKERERLRLNKQFIQGDLLRKEIEALGYIVEDTANGPVVHKK